MKEFFHSVGFKVIAGLLVVALGFLIAAGSIQGFPTLGKNIVGFFVKPFQDFSSWAGDGISTFFTDLFQGSRYRRENEKLRQEAADLRDQLADYDNIRRENENYKDYLGLVEENKDWKLVAASVVERDPAGSYGDFKINKGSLNGIRKRDVVITASGMVGVVSEVGWTYSKVQTILNPALSVGCICSRTGDTGLLSGRMYLASDGLTALSYINKTSGIQVGDYIVTGGSELFPARLVVGKVEKISPDEGGSGLTAELVPTVDIKTVQDVMVITDFFGKVLPEEESSGS